MAHVVVWTLGPYCVCSAAAAAQPPKLFVLQHPTLGPKVHTATHDALRDPQLPITTALLPNCTGDWSGVDRAWHSRVYPEQNLSSKPVDDNRRISNSVCSRPLPHDRRPTSGEAREGDIVVVMRCSVRDKVGLYRSLGTQLMRSATRSNIILYRDCG